MVNAKMYNTIAYATSAASTYFINIFLPILLIQQFKYTPSNS